jgi:DNA topoisomerase-2
MAIWTLTLEKANKLLKDVADKEQEIEILIKKSPTDLWSTDLDEFLIQWKHQLEEDKRMEQTVVKKKGVSKLSKGKTKKKKDETEDEYDGSPQKRKKAAPTKKQTTLPFMPADPEKKPTARAATKKSLIIDDDDGLDDSDFEMLVGSVVKENSNKAEKPAKENVTETKMELDSDLDAIAEVKGKTVQPKEESEDSEDEKFDTPPSEKVTTEYDIEDSEISDVKPVKAAPKKTAGKAAPKASSTKAASSKPAAKSKAAAAAKKSIFDFGDEDSDDIAPKIRTKRPAASKKSAVVDEIPDDEDDELESMVEKSKSDNAAPSRGKSTLSSKGVMSKNKPTPMDLSDLENNLSIKSNSKKAAPAKKPTASKKAAPSSKSSTKGRGKKIVESDEDDALKMLDELLSDSSDEEILPRPKAPSSKPTTISSKNSKNTKSKSVPPSKSTKKEPETFEDEVEKVEKEKPVARASRPGRQAAKKPIVTYKLDSDDSDGDDDDDDDDDDDGYDDED